MAVKIYIDQGHNPVNPNAGAEGGGYREQDIVYEIGVRLAAILRENGYETKLSRPQRTTQLGTSTATSLAARVNEANAWGADYFISLHTNSSVNPQAGGTEILVYSLTSPAYPLAESILEQLTLSTGFRSRGVVPRPGLYVLKKTQMPALLAELGFISNPEEAALMANSPELFARGIANGIFDYFNRSEDTYAEVSAEVQAMEMRETENPRSEEPPSATNMPEKSGSGAERPNSPEFSENGENGENGESAENSVFGVENAEVPRDNPPAVSDCERDDYDGTYDEFIAENNKTGMLKIQAYRGNQSVPEAGVVVRISKEIGDGDYIFFEGMTDGSGIIESIVLPAPPRDTTLEYGRPDKTAIYVLEAEKEGFIPIRHDIEMFEGVKTIQPLRMKLAGGKEVWQS